MLNADQSRFSHRAWRCTPVSPVLPPAACGSYQVPPWTSKTFVVIVLRGNLGGDGSGQLMNGHLGDSLQGVIPYLISVGLGYCE